MCVGGGGGGKLLCRGVPELLNPFRNPAGTGAKATFPGEAGEDPTKGIRFRV